MSITISADDLRSIRAVEIAAAADQWVMSRTDSGEVAFQVPSQCEADRAYTVTMAECDCPDFQRNAVVGEPGRESEEVRACKHVLAVRLYNELVRAQRHLDRLPAQRRRAS